MGDAWRTLAEKDFDVWQAVAIHLHIYEELTDKS